jgi:hypothetical protein
LIDFGYRSMHEMVPAHPPLPAARNLPFQFSRGHPQLHLDMRIGRRLKHSGDAAMSRQRRPLASASIALRIIRMP